MGVIPPASLVRLIHQELQNLLSTNPASTSSEAYIQHHLEFEILRATTDPKYFIRIGINYHGDKVQQLRLDADGRLQGWNRAGDALGTGRRAKMLLAGHTIFDRDPDEQRMSDTKIGGGDLAAGQYVRMEFKARGWLGKTKNLDGAQLEKDIDLLKDDRADLLVICLSETAHRKWRGEGPRHQADRRTGTVRFQQILVDLAQLPDHHVHERQIDFEGQRWIVSAQRIAGAETSIMPGAEHIVTMVWRAPPE
ncbi:MAG: hypothetical protein HBSAPP03_04990 [Phycisphaerae bacterium]|nr:MAG: hypothetical protein HBSAPP03_04990 [Phycisphaerae bacterium]